MADWGLGSLGLICAADYDREVVSTSCLAHNKVASAKDRRDSLAVPLRLGETLRNLPQSFNLFIGKRVIDCA